MREQSKWRRVVAAVAIGVGFALVGVGLHTVRAMDATWSADATWSLTSVQLGPTVDFSPQDATWSE